MRPKVTYFLLKFNPPTAPTLTWSSSEPGFHSLVEDVVTFSSGGGSGLWADVVPDLQLTPRPNG